jgi:phage terminase large subunit-like protein
MVRRDLVKIAKDWKIKEFCADPWQMHDLGKQLAEEDGVPVVLVPQRYEKLSVPTKILQGKILDRRIRHDHNPLMTVMVGNTATRPDDRGNVMTSKRKSRGRIDGMQAAINALAQIPVVKPAELQMFFVGGKK